MDNPMDKKAFLHLLMRTELDLALDPHPNERLITTKTDDFSLVKEAAHYGRLVNLKLIWSFKWWRWMYKYTWYY